MPNSRHSPAIFSPSSSRATNLRRSSIGLHSFQGMFALPQKARLCNPCLRNELSPLSQEGHFRVQPLRQCAGLMPDPPQPLEIRLGRQLDHLRIGDQFASSATLPFSSITQIAVSRMVEPPQ